MSTQIAIDLTPMRPGGENGGAKTLMWQLLNNFKSLTPEFSFLLLTAEWNHAELAVFDGPGFKRYCVLSGEGTKQQPSSRSQWWEKWLHRLRSRLPISLIQQLRPAVQRLKIKARFLRNVASPDPSTSLNLLSEGVRLLFCPFTAVTYSEPGLGVISFVHDLQHRVFPQFFDPAEIEGRERTFFAVAIRADWIVCNSEFTKETLLAHFETIKPERVSVIPIAVHSRLSEVKPIDSKLEVLEKMRRPFLYYPANFWPHKNHRMLLTAFNTLLHQRPDLNLDIVFTGAPSQEQEHLKSAVQGMNLADRVHFGGFLPDEAIAGLFMQCEAVIYPSLYEGFGIPILEAFTFGKPVLCSDVTSLPEVAGKGALYFNPRKPDEILQAISTLLDDKSLTARLVQAGQKRLAVFEPGQMIAAYAACFETALAENVGAEDAFQGVYADGWAGPEAAFHYKPDFKTWTFSITFFTPEWHPKSAVNIDYIHPVTGLSVQVTLARGEVKTLRIPLKPEGGQIVFSFSPTFRPSEHEGTEDERQLSCILKKWHLVE